MTTHMKRRSLRSLRNSETFRQFVLDQLEGLDVRAKSMFGGTGLYSGEYFFGIIARDVLYLKTDDVNRGPYLQAGMRPFNPYADRPVTMHYFEVPLAVLESSLELEKWARAAVGAAKRAAEGRTAKTKK